MTRRERTSRYKPLVVRQRHKTEERFPKINPSVREIWKITSDHRFFFKKKELGDIIDKEIDFRNLERSLIQSEDYSYEEIIDMEKFLTSLVSLAKSKHIKLIIPLKTMTKEEYDQIKEEDY